MSGLFSTVSKRINKLVIKQQGNQIMHKELEKLLKSLTTLSNLAVIYLAIKWGYSGLEFILRSLLN
jgi:hypothetical protein